MVPLLRIMSTMVSIASKLRLQLYKTGVWQQARLPVPVISVGNITWGGNGKTPMALMIARRCWEVHNVKPLVLSRGYLGGDEARMLSTGLQGTPAVIGVGADRAAVAMQMLRAHTSIGVAILDDGMQHLRLARDLEICMINALKPFGNGHIIPRGPLREEPQAALQRCDIAVVHHSTLVQNSNQLLSLEKFLHRCLRPGKAVLHTEMQLIACRQVAGPPIKLTTSSPPSEKNILSALRGAHLLCLTAIGCPEALELQLRRLGAKEVEGAAQLHDHQQAPMEVIRSLARRAAQLQAAGSRVVVVLTEKDCAREEESEAWTHLCIVPVVVLCGEVAVSDMSLLDAHIERALRSGLSNHLSD